MVFGRGNGVYRGVFAAIVGLSLIGAGEPPETGAQPKQGNDPGSIVTKPASADFAAPEQPIASRPDKGCEQGKDRRDSDLCAQWKAADAATDAAQAAWWQFWLGTVGLILGAVTMAAAIAAAVYARSAAKHTETGANEAKRSADAAHDTLKLTERSVAAQLRPHIEINISPQSVKLISGLVKIDYTLEFTNLGAGEALHFIGCDEVLCGSENFITEANSIMEQHRSFDFANRQSILPKEKLLKPRQVLKSVQEIKLTQDFSYLQHPSFTVVLAVTASYKFEFGSNTDRERVERVFMLRYKMPNDLLSAHFNLIDMPVLGDRLVIDQVTLSPEDLEYQYNG
jgi:hypothetical protein